MPGFFIIQIKAYRVLRQDKRGSRVVDYFDYYPEEMFIGVRGLHSHNGIPTLDVVWLDFEVYGKQVRLNI